jgi:hypothetical protein
MDSPDNRIYPNLLLYSSHRKEVGKTSTMREDPPFIELAIGAGLDFGDFS